MNVILTLLCFLFLTTVQAQMDNHRLEKLLTNQVDSISGTTGRWQATFNKVPFIIVTDEKNDRMRVIAPITEISQLDKELLLDCLTANFHSALDVKYAISDGILWSVYIHPLSLLSDREVISAVEQVYAAAVTFGTTFSSTPLLFGGGQRQPQGIKKDSILLKRT